jgi:hypothetical protein
LLLLQELSTCKTTIPPATFNINLQQPTTTTTTTPTTVFFFCSGVQVLLECSLDFFSLVVAIYFRNKKILPKQTQ